MNCKVLLSGSLSEYAGEVLTLDISAVFLIVIFSSASP